VPVLAHDERAAVGAVAAVLGAVVARVELQLAGLRPGRHGDAVAAEAEVEVDEAERGEGDERERDDSCGAERLHGLSFRRVHVLDARSAARRRHRREGAFAVVPAADSASYLGRRQQTSGWDTFTA
jgi:hypothetical protein